MTVALMPAGTANGRVVAASLTMASASIRKTSLVRPMFVPLIEFRSITVLILA